MVVDSKAKAKTLLALLMCLTDDPEEEMQRFEDFLTKPRSPKNDGAKGATSEPTKGRDD